MSSNYRGKRITRNLKINKNKRFSREYSPQAKNNNQTKAPNSLLRPANENYIKASLLLKPAFEAKGRLDLTQGKKSFDDTKKKFYNIAKNYCEDVWRGYCEVNNLNYINGFEVPKSLLSKKGNIQPAYGKVLLDHLSEDFDILDDFPHMPDNNLIKTLITSPKTVVAQTCINGMTEFRHSRPCVILRQLLECDVHGTKYLLVNDIKFYQNSPVIASPLIVLRNGYKKGACLISRIDEIGQLSPEEYEHYKEIYLKQHPRAKLVDPIYPQYLLDKFEDYHQNTRNLTTNKFFKINETAPQTRHIHKGTEEFFMLNALAVLESSYNFSKTKMTDKIFKAFNAQELSLEDYCVDSTSTKDVAERARCERVYQGATAIQEYFDDMTRSQLKIDEFAVEKVIPNNGLISTADIIKLINNLYNTNYVADPKLVETLDELRKFVPERRTRYIDSSLLPPLDKNALVVKTPQNNKLEQYVRKNAAFGMFIDDEYLKAHLADLPDLQEPTEQPPTITPPSTPPVKKK